MKVVSLVLIAAAKLWFSGLLVLWLGMYYLHLLIVVDIDR